MVRCLEWEGCASLNPSQPGVDSRESHTQIKQTLAQDRGGTRGASLSDSSPLLNLEQLHVCLLAVEHPETQTYFSIRQCARHEMHDILCRHNNFTEDTERDKPWSARLRRHIAKTDPQMSV